MCWAAADLVQPVLVWRVFRPEAPQLLAVGVLSLRLSKTILESG